MNKKILICFICMMMLFCTACGKKEGGGQLEGSLIDIMERRICQKISGRVWTALRLSS